MTDEVRAPKSSRMLERNRPVSLASVLLRTLERLCEIDDDQTFLKLYNELKPYCERRLRRRERS